MSDQGKSVGIWTPANIVTMVRIVFCPVWLLLAEWARTAGLLWQGNAIAYLSFFVYLVLTLTDKLDGYLARSRNEVSDFGKFLDPIADKLVVLIAMIYLGEVNLIPSWMTLVVLAREFLVSGLRMLVASEGTVVAASNLGKAKTATTMAGLCALLLYVALPASLGACDPLLGSPSGLGFALYWIGEVSMWVAVALTAWSGADYFIKCWPLVSRS
jgi:CDP-diacylglycerol--glycerol-3-phosphate 3-phosphatidyltransferase